MRVIPPKIHGMLDYIVAVILILIPWLLDFAGPNPATYVMVALGVITIGYSLFTSYEWGAIKIISMYMHLRLDLFFGALLALSPWIFSFSKYIWAPHLLLGVLEVLVALMTNPVTHETDLDRMMKRKDRFLKRHFL